MVPLAIGICVGSMSVICLAKKMYDKCYDNANTDEKDTGYLSDDTWFIVKIDSIV